MSKKLKGKVAVVTGASKGIGAAIAKSLASEGATVIVNYSSDREGAERVVEHIKKEGQEAVAVQANISLSGDVARLFATVGDKYGKIDVLVNSAGVFRFEPFEEVKEESYHWHFNTNVLGTVLSIQEALKLFPDTGGSIINIGSVVIQNPLPTTAIYSASKGAIASLSLTLARELGGRKIRVNVVSPGATETEGVHATGIIMGTDFEKQIIASTPLGRLAQPNDIAQVVTFLASDDSAWVTGTNIEVAGGQH